MNILVTLANYGTKNDGYLHRLLEEYRSMSHRVHVVVLTNQPKELGSDIEVCVERPLGDPWTFPFAHKRILAERCSVYDLFIYSEDDTLITQRNIDAFVWATATLKQDEIAGFLRSETGLDNKRYYSSIHSHFHWDPASIVSRGDCLYARFSNEHSASYILTQKQLRRAIDSGGFLVEPHQEKYDLLVTAATDPYTQCGLKKLINISRLQDFTLPHLPNKYVGQMGLAENDLDRQVDALRSIAQASHPCSMLFDSETHLPGGKWSKSYYETPRSDIEQLIPAEVRTLLSYGCGCGELESSLMERGVRVTAIPIDSVIGRCAEARGMRVVYGDSHRALSQISRESFDCVLVIGVLHLLPQPQRVLSDLAALLSPGGVIVASAPNMRQAPVLWRRATRQRGFTDLGKHDLTGVQLTSARVLRKWLNQSNLVVRKVDPVVSRRARRFATVFSDLVASEWLVVGAKI